MALTFSSIQESFQVNRQFLTKEQSVCYILHSLLSGDSYGTQLIAELKTPYYISDTILYAALSFLIESGTIRTYTAKLEGRGRPRVMLAIADGSKEIAIEMAFLWKTFTQSGL